MAGERISQQLNCTQRVESTDIPGVIYTSSEVFRPLCRILAKSGGPVVWCLAPTLTDKTCPIAKNARGEITDKQLSTELQKLPSLN